MRVLPGVHERVGDHVLLLDRDLVDDQVGQALVVVAVEIEGAAELVGLLRVRALQAERFGFFQFAFFLR